MVLVVVLLPVGDDRASFINVVEGIHVQAFITHATVERFNVAVAPGLTGWNVVNTEFSSANSPRMMEMNSVRYRSVRLWEAPLGNDFL